MICGFLTKFTVTMSKRKNIIYLDRKCNRKIHKYNGELYGWEKMILLEILRIKMNIKLNSCQTNGNKSKIFNLYDHKK